ncbi:hypothetical protein L1D50_09645 [Pseudoalteromonas sp. Isolate6]|uniref:hypothetical protein n=1 Tax=Pseudoalteromonas sp. Isolate6 TaxID=2908527 RepID=UPI001EFD2504|nr:hypothetical protein [Pseudoalteromonas sp. Isolate6]MCG9759368.1 hypothetical protein [Pseudoalteromonas sp. Isolate6]
MTGTIMKNLLSVFTFIIFILLGYYFLREGLFSGSEFIAFVTLGLVVTLLIKLVDQIESFSIGGNEVKLSKENEKAERNIARLKEIADALVDSLIIPLPTMADSPQDLAYDTGLNFVKIYEITSSLNTQADKPISHQKIERALRDYLTGTTLNIQSQAMYTTNDPLPDPSMVLNKFSSTKQREGIKNSKAFELYKNKLYPIYINSAKKS